MESTSWSPRADVRVETVGAVTPTGAMAHTGPVAGASDDSPDLERLTRWVNAGGLWEVVTTSPDTVTIGLCRCDGGEEVDRFTTCDPLVLRYLGGRRSSEE